MSVYAEVEMMIAEMGELSAHGRALAAAALLLAADVDDPPRTVTGPRAITGYVSGLRAALTELAEIQDAQPAQKVTVVDELAGRRQTRAAGAADPVRPARRRKSGDG